MSTAYKILGLSENASIQEVRMAYRRLAAQYHPDRNHGDLSAEEMFKRVISAYRLILKGADLPASGKQASKSTKPCHAPRSCRRKRTGTRSDRRYNWQLSEQYIGTKVNCEA